MSLVRIALATLIESPARMLTADTFRDGDHICALYTSAEEQEAVAARFIAGGLRAGQRCVFAAGSPAMLGGFGRALQVVGLDPGAEQRRGALLLLTNDQAHLVDGCFDSERMLRSLNQMMEDALNDRFTGLRTCGDMTWLLDRVPGSAQIVEYEALVTELFKSGRALGMCQYDQSRLPAELIDYALATHMTVLVDGRHVLNPFSKPLPAAFTSKARPDDVPRKLAELRRAARG